PVLGGSLLGIAGPILRSLTGKHLRFRVRHPAYPLIAAACFGIVAVVRKLGLGHAGALFDAAVNVTAAMLAATTFVVASGNRGALRCDRGSLLYFVGGGIAENAGVFLVLVALGFGDVSVVSPLTGTAPLFVLFLAYLFPSGAGKLNGRIVLGAVLIVSGVMLLSR